MGKYNQKSNHYEISDRKNSKRSAADILREIVDYSYQKEAYLGHQIEGDYLIAYMVEKARELQYLKDGLEVMKKLQYENAFIGIAVHSTSDLRFIQNLIVMVTVIDERGRVIGKQQHLYHPRPGLHNYGKNWKLPGDGLYTLQVHLDFPDLQWERDLKDIRGPESVEVEFPHVMIQTGQHIS
jgi:hypothetical protein